MKIKSLFNPTFSEKEMANESINEKHLLLGGNEGILGRPLSEVCTCSDNTGFYKSYQNGRIYWTYAIGAYGVYGQVFEQWSKAGFEKSPFGYPVSDEKETMSGSVKYNRFQSGIIYNSAEVCCAGIMIPIARSRINSWYQPKQYATS